MNKQHKGTIVRGNGINWEERAAEAEKRGFEVRVFDEHIELWIDPKELVK